MLSVHVCTCKPRKMILIPWSPSRQSSTVLFVILIIVTEDVERKMM